MAENFYSIWPKNDHSNNYYFNNNFLILRFFIFPKRIELVRQIAERHAEDGDDDVGDGRPPLEHFDEEFQAEVVDEYVAYCDEEIPDNLCPAA